VKSEAIPHEVNKMVWIEYIIASTCIVGHNILYNQDMILVAITCKPAYASSLETCACLARLKHELRPWKVTSKVLGAS
jgi:hypothetical protein